MAAESTPTPFAWPSGPSSVQISGDWDQWKDKVDLDKQTDGSFSGKIPLPSNTKVHYKYIVDGQWTTNPSSPIVDDSGNQNNVVDVGPAPTAAESATTKATEIGAGIAAGVAGAAAAASAAATNFVDQVNGTEGKTTETKEKEPTTEEKKEDPAAALKKSADDDIRNQVPDSITSVSHGAMPVLASAVATVTGADIMRGNPESLPVTQKEINDTQAEAMKGDNSFVGARTEPQGGAISDPAAATTENSKAAATVASNATVGGPVVPVTNNGFAANVTGASGNLTTAADQGKEGGEKAGAVAGASAGALGATVAGAAAVANSNEKKETETKAAPAPSAATAAAPPQVAKKEEPVASSAPIAALPGVAAASSKGSAQLPTTAGTVNSSKAQADKATAPAAASSAPLAAGKETTTPAAVADKSLPVTPKKSTSSAHKEKPAAAAANKSDTIREKGSRASALKNNTTTTTANSAAAPAATASKIPEPISAPATPDKKKKTGLFGKIKQALSPHGSPGK